MSSSEAFAGAFVFAASHGLAPPIYSVADEACVVTRAAGRASTHKRRQLERGQKAAVLRLHKDRASHLLREDLSSRCVVHSSARLDMKRHSSSASMTRHSGLTCPRGSSEGSTLSSSTAQPQRAQIPYTRQCESKESASLAQQDKATVAPTCATEGTSSKKKRWCFFNAERH